MSSVRPQHVFLALQPFYSQWLVIYGLNTCIYPTLTSASVSYRTTYTWSVYPAELVGHDLNTLRQSSPGMLLYMRTQQQLTVRGTSATWVPVPDKDTSPRRLSKLCTSLILVHTPTLRLFPHAYKMQAAPGTAE